MKRTVVTVLVALALVLPGRTPAMPSSLPDQGGRADTVSSEVLVKFKPGASPSARSASVAAAGHAYLGALDASGWVHARVGPGQTVAQALAAYQGDPTVELAQPNYVYRALRIPGDTSYRLLWGWKNSGQAVSGAPTQPAGTPINYTTHNPGTAGSDMNLEKAWDQITDCSGVVVAVVDSGVNYTHVDLAANMWNGGPNYPNHGWSFVAPAGNDPMDLNGHGTHVAGIVGAVGNNGLGTVGVCWKASLMAVRVLDAEGGGSTATVIQGIDFAVAHGARVINLSLGGGGAFDQAFSDAITGAQAADVVVVAAAGNDGKNNEAAAIYPCNFTHPNLICVAALDQAYALASFSNWGATSVDVGAPGTNIVSAWPGPALGDPLTAGWTMQTNGTGANDGWFHATTTAGYDVLIDPGVLGSGTYGNNLNDRIWKTFNLGGARAGTLGLGVVLGLSSGDSFRVAASSSSGLDPFASGLVRHTETAVNTPNVFTPISADITNCTGATCTVGFQLLSDAVTQTTRGLEVGFLALGTVSNGSTAYNTENGTSMATPAVAGLAAMLRAFNPAFTHTDVIGAIKGGGRPVAALAGKTTSGRAADAMGSLAFINPPTGVAATIH